MNALQRTDVPHRVPRCTVGFCETHGVVRFVRVDNGHGTILNICPACHAEVR